MANLGRLKTKAANKGTPPQATNRNLKTQPREKPVPTRKIEFSVPETVFDDFSEASFKRFGFKKGAKSKLFLAMWEEFQSG
jgi:hypothetical protein